MSDDSEPDQDPELDDKHITDPLYGDEDQPLPEDADHV